MCLLAQTDRRARDSAWRSRRLFARVSPFCSARRQRIPENGATYSKTDKARHLCRDPEPLPHFAVVLAATKNDAADMTAATSARCRYDAFAILAAIQPFNLPQIWFDAGVLKLFDRLDHQAGPQLAIVGRFVAI